MRRTSPIGTLAPRLNDSAPHAAELPFLTVTESCIAPPCSSVTSGGDRLTAGATRVQTASGGFVTSTVMLCVATRLPLALRTLIRTVWAPGAWLSGTPRVSAVCPSAAGAMLTLAGASAYDHEAGPVAESAKDSDAQVPGLLLRSAMATRVEDPNATVGRAGESVSDGVAAVHADTGGSVTVTLAFAVVASALVEPRADADTA